MNDKPNYSEGTTRHSIVNLLHVASVLTPRTYEVFDCPTVSVKWAMNKLKTDGIIEKRSNGEIFYCFYMDDYQFNKDKYFEGNIPFPNLICFEKNGTLDIKRAKYSKGKDQRDAIRTLLNGEVIALMHYSGAHTYPDEKYKISQQGMINNNSYYPAREIKTYTGSTVDANPDDLPVEKSSQATRITGILLSEGGNYTIYHLGKSLKKWSANGEYKLRMYAQNMLNKYQPQLDCNINSTILIAHKLTLFTQIVANESKDIYRQYGVLNDAYSSIYAIPYNRYGRDLLRIMQKEYWQTHLMEYLMDAPVPDTRKASVTCDYIENGIYILLFCVPDIKRLIAFRHAAIHFADKSQFQVYCFDFQREFITQVIGDYAEIMETDFYETLKDYEG